jgi:hypoxanthine-DNA glycosylase
LTAAITGWPTEGRTAATSALVRSFPPALGASLRALVLGSMPGVASLRAGQYYAHPRNAFWPLMQTLFAIPGQASYADRVAALNAAGIALWDVLAECERPGSLDSAIAPASIMALNGGTAARLFERNVAPRIVDATRCITVLRLPSTSPAHAARSLAQKTEAWHALRRAIDDAGGDPSCA